MAARYFMFEGEKLCLSSIAKKLGMSPATFNWHVNKRGFDGAVSYARLSPEEKRKVTSQKISKGLMKGRLKQEEKPVWHGSYENDLPEFDEDLALKNTINSLLNQGFSVEQIKQRYTAVRIV